MGSSKLTTNSRLHAGLECSGVSNISVSGFSRAELFSNGGALSAGLGTGTFGSCNSIRLLNGSYSLSGGTGLGAGFSNSSGNSVVNLLEIVRGTIKARATNSGAGIGSGYSES
jgi:hypothetical protein